MTDAPANPSPTRERNLLEAWLFGWSWLLAAIGAVLLAVYAILWLCGMPFRGEDLIAPGGAFAASLVLRGYSKMAQ